MDITLEFKDRKHENELTAVALGEHAKELALEDDAVLCISQVTTDENDNSEVDMYYFDEDEATDIYNALRRYFGDA